MPRSLMTMVTWWSASGSEAPEVPVVEGAAQVGARVPFHGVVEVGEFQRVAQEEDRRVVAHEIPVALFGVELHGEAADVALGVGGAALARRRWKSGRTCRSSFRRRRRSWPWCKRVMSWVTVKVPKAPDPLACMRRSGITSRSKWASFSRYQTSWSRTGPRGPAVMVFWLSTTGRAVAGGQLLGIVHHLLLNVFRLSLPGKSGSSRPP